MILKIRFLFEIPEYFLRCAGDNFFHDFVTSYRHLADSQTAVYQKWIA
jgi:hypothetical protein